MDTMKPLLVASSIMLAYLAAQNVKAEINVDLGAVSATYKDAQTSFGYQGRISLDQYPIYLAAGYESPKVRMLGQPLADGDIYTTGLGFHVELFPKLSLMAEAGYAYPDLQSQHEIEREVIYTQLVNNHYNPNRPIPLVSLDRYETSWEVDGAMYGKVGLSYQFNDWMAMSASYRVLNLNQEYTLRAPEADRPALIEKYGAYGEGYWREDTELNMSAWEFGLWVTF